MNATSRRGENESVSNRSGQDDNVVGESEISSIVETALKEYDEQTKGEAGRSEGRIFPELVVGAQVYPNPRMWGPDTGGVPLTEDEGYGDVARMLDRLDREDGFDGRQ
jgi:hypothetical protein